MPELEVVKQAALGVLRTAGPFTASLLIDRAERIALNADYIAQLDEITRIETIIDRSVISCAAYISDLAVALEQNQIFYSEPVFEKSAAIAAEKLAGKIPRARIEKISKVLIESASRLTRMCEAMVLSDARSLDDMGLVGLLREFCRCLGQGKGISAMLTGWKRRVEYGYWDARINESFRFETTKKIAAQRIARMEKLIAQLELESSASEFVALKTLP